MIGEVFRGGGGGVDYYLTATQRGGVVARKSGEKMTNECDAVTL